MYSGGLLVFDKMSEPFYWCNWKHWNRIQNFCLDDIFISRTFLWTSIENYGSCVHINIDYAERQNSIVILAQRHIVETLWHGQLNKQSMKNDYLYGKLNGFFVLYYNYSINGTQWGDNIRFECIVQYNYKSVANQNYIDDNMRWQKPFIGVNANASNLKSMERKCSLWTTKRCQYNYHDNMV